MLNYIGKRLILAVPLLLGLSMLVFFMLSWIPGGAPEIMAMLGGQSVSANQLAQLRHQLGLDAPLPVQYVRFLTRALQGDLGRSFRTNRPVVDMILENLPATLELALAGLILSILLGLGLGLVAGLRRGGWLDLSSMVLALLGWSMPQFWLGIVLILVFSVKLGWLPITNGSELERLVLPSVALALGSAGVIARLARTEILEELRKNYVVAARAKGLSESGVILKHVLRNSLVSVVTVAGLQFGQLLGGAVIIETVFARQGVGRLAVDALLARDMPVVQGAVLFLGAIFIITNLVVDIAYGYLDPRLRIGSLA
jgi:peptide/nickel transport system permease protein